MLPPSGEGLGEGRWPSPKPYPPPKNQHEPITIHRRQLRMRKQSIACVLLIAAFFGALNLVSSHPTAASPSVPPFSHVFEIVMENKAYDRIIGSSSAPYINSLAQQYGLATNFYAIMHPSLPDYLALTGGSTFGITSDCTDCFVNAPNL